jgi:hypothetical protein
MMIPLECTEKRTKFYATPDETSRGIEIMLKCLMGLYIPIRAFRGGDLILGIVRVRK